MNTTYLLTTSSIELTASVEMTLITGKCQNVYFEQKNIVVALKKY